MWRTQTEDYTGRDEQFLDEYAQWDRLAVSVASQADEPGLTPEVRAATLKAIAFFRVRFGELWLRLAFEHGHPFTELVTNRAPWTRGRMAELADAIQQVDGLAGGRRLSDRYARADQHSGAVLELDLAATALRQGLKVELEPKTQPGRTCDLLVAEPTRVRSNTLFVEVQSIQDFGDDTKRAMQVAERLAPRLMWALARCELLGEIYRIPGDHELTDLVKTTDEFWKQCESASEPLHLVLDDVMDVWAVPFGHPGKKELVASGVPDTFRSPAPDDPLRRTVRAIRLKIGQLPTLAPGLVVLRPPRLLLPSVNYLPHIVSAVRQAIHAAPQVSAVALIDRAFRSTGAPVEARAEMAGALVIDHPEGDAFVREIVLIHNPSRAYKLADGVIGRLF